jgi:hypothetical protein
MTKEAFIGKYLEELTGLLLVSFFAVDDVKHARTPEDFQRQGKAMIEQQRRARAILERAWNDLQPPLPAKPAEAPKGGKP